MWICHDQRVKVVELKFFILLLDTGQLVTLAVHLQCRWSLEVCRSMHTRSRYYCVRRCICVLRKTVWSFSNAVICDRCDWIEQIWKFNSVQWDRDGTRVLFRGFINKIDHRWNYIINNVAIIIVILKVIWNKVLWSSLKIVIRRRS